LFDRFGTLHGADRSGYISERRKDFEAGILEIEIKREKFNCLYVKEHFRKMLNFASLECS
jgi:hypothetical protein